MQTLRNIQTLYFGPALHIASSSHLHPRKLKAHQHADPDRAEAKAIERIAGHVVQLVLRKATWRLAHCQVLFAMDRELFFC